MFQLPKEIQKKIFSYDPTYHDLFKKTLFQFSKCTFCHFDERIEFECEYFETYNEEIKKNFGNYRFCSLQCMALAWQKKDTSIFDKVWHFDSFQLRNDS